MKKKRFKKRAKKFAAKKKLYRYKKGKEPSPDDGTHSGGPRIK